MKPLLILRPEPGATATAERARAMGLEPVVMPLFAIAALGWDVPDAADYDALLLTSANAVRHGGPGLRRFNALPVFAVGGSTAQAARTAGFANVETGAGAVQDSLALAASQGTRRLLHLAGHDFRNASHPALIIDRCFVYVAEEVAPAPEVPATPCVALVHSPRAAKRLAEIAGAGKAHIALVAISPAALGAAGSGWAEGVAASRPEEVEMLALAVQLCQQTP